MPDDQNEPSGDVHVERSKFDLGGPAPAIDVGELPWSYGENRITAIVRDPDSAYLYWEITDDAISMARAALGPAGTEGWCCLRVYDTTGHTFDGTNANDYFDVRVDRTDRDYFLMIRRPTSTIYVEIGIKTVEGYFQPIARSGRAEFPRNDPSPNTLLEWMTVTVTSDGAPPAASPCRSRYGGPVPPLPGRAGAGYVDVWRAAYAPAITPEVSAQARAHASWSGAAVRRTVERSAHIERWWHLDEWRSEWRGGLRFVRSEGPLGDHVTTWREGPFPLELWDPERVAVELLGQTEVRLHAQGIDFTVYGPWRFTIRSWGGESHRRVLSTWSVRWVRAMSPQIESWGFGAERRVLAAFERGHEVQGASERHALLERGASELWRLGGSERLWLGASEWALLGGSETLFLAASQLAGASALLARGASERFGASEFASAWMGGSARVGASESVGGGERWAARPDGTSAAGPGHRRDLGSH